MTHPASYERRIWRVHVNERYPASPVDDTFLSRLVAELDDDAVTAIILRGSYARGDASAYSDVDLTRFVKQLSERVQQTQFTFCEGRLISISTRTIDQERARLSAPETAIFVVSGLREARILLEKDGAFCALQQEARAFTWEPLQAAANSYASTILMEHTEYVLKILRGLLLHDEYALAEIALELLFVLTDAVAVQRGMLVISGNTYFRQAEELIGLDSAWTHYHKLIAGIDTSSEQRVSSEVRGVAALRFYQETVKLLQFILDPRHRDVVEQTVVLIDAALSEK